MSPTKGVQLVRRSNSCDERTVDQGEEWEVEELWVWFYFVRLCLGKDTTDAATVLHSIYLHRLNHVCRDGSTICLGMLVSLRFPFLIPSSGGLIVRRWFILSIHMLLWTSGVTQIWYCRLANSGVPLVNSLTIFMSIVFLL